MEFQKRKQTRLKGYDYSSPGAYFVTICTQNRECILGDIVGQGLAPAEMRLSQYGKIAKDQLLDLEHRYKSIKINKYVIMPNHIHVIIIIDNAAGASHCPTISDIICSYKSLTTRMCNKLDNKQQKIFQTSFHDHIIRGEKDHQKIWEYIDTNVLRWKKDCFHNNEKMEQ